MNRVTIVGDTTGEDGMGEVAVTIGRIDDNQRHLGILYRTERSTFKMLHLAWHHDLRSEEPKRQYLKVDPNIHPLRLRQVAAMCRKIWRANEKGGIPYAFGMPNACFDSETAEYLFGGTTYGLTCASFVVAVFQATGTPLLKQETWPTGRDGDEEWQKQIIEYLENSGATEKHIEKIRDQMGAVRFRPEEVAGSAAVNPCPADFQSALPVAAAIVKRLNKEIAG